MISCASYNTNSRQTLVEKTALLFFGSLACHKEVMDRHTKFVSFSKGGDRIVVREDEASAFASTLVCVVQEKSRRSSSKKRHGVGFSPFVLVGFITVRNLVELPPPRTYSFLAIDLSHATSARST